MLLGNIAAILPQVVLLQYYRATLQRQYSEYCDNIDETLSVIWGKNFNLKIIEIFK